MTKHTALNLCCSKIMVLLSKREDLHAADVAAPYVKKGITVATPYVRAGADVVTDVAKPVIRAAGPVVKVLSTMS